MRGLIPWVPLTNFTGAPEALLQQCRDRIGQQASPEETENLLAATQVFAEMRYSDPKLLGVLGGNTMTMRDIYLASPTIQILVAEKTRGETRRNILRILSKRFKSVPEELAAHLTTFEDQNKLDGLIDIAMDCVDLEAFRVAMNETS